MPLQATATGGEDSKQVEETPEGGTNSHAEETMSTTSEMQMRSQQDEQNDEKPTDAIVGKDETGQVEAETVLDDEELKSTAEAEEFPGEESGKKSASPVTTSSSSETEVSRSGDPPAEGPAHLHTTPVVATVTEDDSLECEEKKDSTLSEFGMDVSTSNDDEISHFNSSKKEDTTNDDPMDASGRLSEDLLRDLPTISTSNSNSIIRQEALPEIKETILDENFYKPELEPIGTIENHVSPHALPTPVAGATKRESDAAIQLAALEYAQLPPDLLANKDKESFGLLARGESFKKEQEAQRQQQEEPQLQHSFDNTNAQPRIPQEPVASHRREESSVANDGPPPVEDSLQHLDVIDDNSHLPDDNSYRHPYPPSQFSYPPSQVSYPPSPQGLPPAPPQTIALNNGAYMVMPQHQGQPAFIAPPNAMLHHQSSFHSHQAQMMGQAPYGYALPNMAPMPSPSIPAAGGKRKIKLKLQEEILARPAHNRRKTFFFGARSTRKLLTQEPLMENEVQTNEVDRGTITVSWYEGTSTMELQEHVNGSVARKLKLQKGQTLDDIRILDTKMDPPEEVVLSPYIPSGSEFVLRYKIKQASGRNSPTFYGPPDSPSAAPSPFPSRGNLNALDDSQLAVLRKQLDEVHDGESRTKSKKYRNRTKRSDMSPLKMMQADAADAKENSEGSDGDNESETNTLQPESSVDAKLRQITELLLTDKQRAQQQRYPQVQKRQVVFLVANYFVLFVAFITVSAEIQARAPVWLSWVEGQLEDVQTCSADQEALYKCISNGEFAGLFATVILWLTRSATTKRFFLFGFDSPQKLWTVFYESLVGAFCWGVSYMFIRRGMNPDTRPQFLQRYWKDCVYGSLAGFNATFMKQVLKNLIPQEAVEEAFNDRQLKILSWLPTFG